MQQRSPLTRFIATTALAIGLGLGLGTGSALATSFNLDLTGTAAAATTSSFDGGGTHYDQWTLELDGLDALNSITLMNGDSVHAVITLDQSVTAPASVQLTSFVFLLRGSSFPNIDTGTTGTMAFLDHGAPVINGGAGTTTSSQLAGSVVFFPPDNGAITFDQVISDFTIYKLDQAATVDHAQLDYTLFSPSVPEPQTWAMLLAGMLLLGGVAARRHRTATRPR